VSEDRRRKNKWVVLQVGYLILYFSGKFVQVLSMEFVVFNWVLVSIHHQRWGLMGG